ncbi:hypothetical protein BpHYR1_053440 [Brachionus plicatilis]|uniref:Uncharacterized protein n=1 Tax=Brachionus plicatilis TaxID=10195 RepID=A0A3M7QHD9_BRAPC|nr:hypothetical protein BpHYR1_053440 [Brachionus plicatilis]
MDHANARRLGKILKQNPTSNLKCTFLYTNNSRYFLSILLNFCVKYQNRKLQQASKLDLQRRETVGSHLCKH